MSGEDDKFVGRLKQAAGELTGDEELKTEGEVDDVEERLSRPSRRWSARGPG